MSDLLKLRGFEVQGRLLFDAVPHHPIQIISPSVALVLSEDGFILAAGPMSKMRSVLRKQMHSASEVKATINGWPRFMRIDFSDGLQPNQTEPRGEFLHVNAMGLIKLYLAFEGKMKAFLEPGHTGFNNARRFLNHVAAPLCQCKAVAELSGSMTRYSAGILESDKAVQLALGRLKLDDDA